MRAHLGPATSSLEAAVAFYGALLAAAPTKRRPGYAKFEPGEPALHLSSNEAAAPLPPRRGGPEHCGLELRSSAEVAATLERMRAAGFGARVEEQSACCYALQDKAWFVDPDGNPWEAFVVVEADVPQRSASGCCGPSSASEPARRSAGCGEAS